MDGTILFEAQQVDLRLVPTVEHIRYLSHQVLRKWLLANTEEPPLPLPTWANIAVRIVVRNHISSLNSHRFRLGHCCPITSLLGVRLERPGALPGLRPAIILQTAVCRRYRLN